MKPWKTVAILLALGGMFPGSGDLIWLGADGKPVPLATLDQLLDFLRTSRVVSATKVEDGINQPSKLLLQKGGVRMHGLFRQVRKVKVREMKLSGRRLELRDDFIFERAAYETARLLGLDNVPPVVERVIEGRPGTLQLWIEKARTVRQDSSPRRNASLEKRLLEQRRAMWVFDNLIYNDDRNKGNVLIGSDGKLWMIDHTQAFRTFGELPYPSLVTHCSKSLYERLRELKDSQLHQALAPFLKKDELQALLIRRDLLVEHIQALIAENGESSVLY